MLKLLKKNYISGYYKNQKYAFDPKNDPYNSDYDWTEEVDEEEMKREIPKEMYMALDGEVFRKSKLGRRNSNCSF